MNATMRIPTAEAARIAFDLGGICWRAVGIG
jgi:hypothetical protein